METLALAEKKAHWKLFDVALLFIRIEIFMMRRLYDVSLIT